MTYWYILYLSTTIYFIVKQQQVNVSDYSNSNIITDYLQAMQVEINSSKSYARVTKSVLTSLSRFPAKPFSSMQRNDIITFFNCLSVYLLFGSENGCGHNTIKVSKYATN
jgi:hypothetical protein